MRRNQLLACLFILGAVSWTVHAQEHQNVRSAHVILLASSYPDSVVLRFGVSSPGGWWTANQHGYRIERVQLREKGEFQQERFTSLTTESHKPWLANDWASRFSDDPSSVSDTSRPRFKGGAGLRYIQIAKQMLYGNVNATDEEESPTLRSLLRAGQDLEGRFGFALFAADMDARAAEASGLRFVDRKVHIGDQFIYRAFIDRPDSNYGFDTAYLVVRVEPHIMPSAPLRFVANSDDGRIRLHWEHPATGGYSGYFIDRSEDSGNTYQRLNETPYAVFLAPTDDGSSVQSHGRPVPEYDDTTVVNYKHYRYRLQGISPFAEPSEPAITDGMAWDRTPPEAPVLASPQQTGPHAVLLSWQQRSTPSDLAGFFIARSSNPMGGFHYLQTTALPPATRSFMDQAADDSEHYYYVAAVDTVGNQAQSIVVASEVIDSTPPTPPTGLVGTMDTDGIVRLRWHPSPEHNLSGYRVLWANDPLHEFTRRTNKCVIDTLFQDSLEVKSLTPCAYYRVRAVNTREQESGMSEVCAIRRPDVIPPVASNFTQVSVSDSGVELFWAHSRSNDVSKQILYRRVFVPDSSQAGRSRRRMGDAGWIEIARLARLSEHFVDRTVTARVVYQYQLVVEDSSGNRSRPSALAMGRSYASGMLLPPSGFSLEYDTTRRYVRVHWRSASKEPGTDDPSSVMSWYEIYRGMNGASPLLYRAVRDSETLTDDGSSMFEDQIPTRGSYTYAIRVESSAGAQSPLSPTLSVEVK